MADYPRWSRAFASVVLATYLLVAGCNFVRPGALKDAPAGDTAARLQAALPELAALGVTYWRDQDWCKVIEYGPRSFVETTNPSTCSTATPRAFDEQARRDFDRVRTLVGSAGGGVYIVSITPDGAGGIEEAGFDLLCAHCDSRGIVYQPDHDIVSNNDLGDRQTRIDKDWWMWETNVEAPS